MAERSKAKGRLLGAGARLDGRSGCTGRSARYTRGWGESQAFFCPVLSFIPTSASVQQFRCAPVYMLCTSFLPPPL